MKGHIILKKQHKKSTIQKITNHSALFCYLVTGLKLYCCQHSAFRLFCCLWMKLLGLLSQACCPPHTHTHTHTHTRTRTHAHEHSHTHTHIPRLYLFSDGGKDAGFVYPGLLPRHTHTQTHTGTTALAVAEQHGINLDMFGQYPIVWSTRSTTMVSM